MGKRRQTQVDCTTTITKKQLLWFFKFHISKTNKVKINEYALKWMNKNEGAWSNRPTRCKHNTKEQICHLSSIPVCSRGA